CALGCASGETWHLVKTPNFVLHAQLDAAAAVTAADALEDARDALISAGWPRLDFDGLEPTDVYVLPSLQELQVYLGPGAAGIFRHGSTGLVLLGGGAQSWERRGDLRYAATSYLRHEMAHQLASVI